MKLTFLGTGTSDGIPVIGCPCSICRSDDPRNKRLRTALYLEEAGHALLLDAGPDLREQAIKHQLIAFDAVLITHSHYDHIGGLNEMRRFNQLMGGKVIDLYANSHALKELRLKYDYFFNPAQLGGGIPQMMFREVTEVFSIGPFNITPIPVKHGELDILGYRINDLAFITDASFISEESFDLLKGVKTLILNALRYEKHPTHFNLEEAVEAAGRIAADASYFIHMTHNVNHQTADFMLPPSVHLAYDGLMINC